MNIRVILAIARKDTVDAIRNMYLLFGIAFPVGLWLLFSVLFPSEGDLKIGGVAVYDQGQSRVVQQLKSISLVEEVIETDSVEELTEVVRKEATGGLAIPAGFDEAVAEGRTPELMVLFNGRRGGGEQAAFRSLTEELIRGLVQQPTPARLVFSDVNEGLSEGAVAEFNTQLFLLVMLIIMGLAMVGAFVVPMLMVEEKEKHTLKVMLVSPASYADVVAGKALAGLFYAMVVAVVLLALNNGLSGNVSLMALAVLLGSLFTVEVGLLVGTMLNTTTQVNTWSTLVLLVLMAPSWVIGIWMPEPVDTAMRFIPTYYLGDLLVKARNGAPTYDAWFSLAVLVAISAVLFVGVVWSLRRQEG